MLQLNLITRFATSFMPLLRLLICSKPVSILRETACVSLLAAPQTVFSQKCVKLTQKQCLLVSAFINLIVVVEPKAL